MENDCILIVDDEERMRKLIKDFLKQKNYNTMETCCWMCDSKHKKCDCSNKHNRRDNSGFFLKRHNYTLLFIMICLVYRAKLRLSF